MSVYKVVVKECFKLVSYSCFFFLVDKRVEDEVASTFRPARSILSSFDTMLQRHPKRSSKPQLARVRLSMPPLKKKCTTTRGHTFQKQIHVFKYAGHSPMVFLNVPKNYEMSGLLPAIAVSDSEDSVREEIMQLVRSKGGRFAECCKDDFEFIRVSRRTAQVPATKAGFEWNGSAIKGLAGLGAIYVRLTRDFDSGSAAGSPNSSDNESQPMPHNKKVPTLGHNSGHHSLPSSSSQQPSSSHSHARDQLDDSDSDFESPPRTHQVRSSHQSRNRSEPTLSCTHTPIEIVNSSDSESGEEVRVDTAVPTRRESTAQHSESSSLHPDHHQEEQLAAMFPDHPRSTIGTVWELSHGDLQIAVDMVLSPPPLTTLLQKLKQKIRSERARIVLDEEDEIEMFHSVIAYYKLPSFDPTLDVRVRFRDQPAVDTGGPRRQMFTSAFAAFATSPNLNLFEQDGRYLRPRYSVQNVMSNLMFILGRMIAHALVLEAIGFPYFSCCHYWYIATGDQVQALQYAGLEDVSPHVRELLVQVIFKLPGLF